MTHFMVSAGILASCIALALTGVLCDLIGWQSIFYLYGKFKCNTKVSNISNLSIYDKYIDKKDYRVII